MLVKYMNFFKICGLPILQAKIDPNSYDKQKLINTFEKNYKKQKIRQKLSFSSFETNIHHSLNDEENKMFEKPDYSKLIPNYQKPLMEYAKKVNLLPKTKMQLYVVNYTCNKHKSFMEPHIHMECEFSMIHYVKFDEKQHAPTTFLNPYESWEWWSKSLQDKIDLKKITQAWVYTDFVFPTQEDDVIIFPSMFRHFVNNKESDSPRITISSNVTLNI